MIYITDTLRISRVDDNCLQLETYVPVTSKKTKETRTQWRWCGYYGDVRGALLAALRKELFSEVSVESSIQRLLDRIDSAEKNIIRAIEGMKQDERQEV